MKKYLWTFIITAITVLITSGCTTISKNLSSGKMSSDKTNYANNTNPNMNSLSPSNNWFTGLIFLVDGKIIQIHHTKPYSIELNVIGSTSLTKPSPEFPVSPGSKITIRFTNNLPSKGVLNPTIGERVEIGVKEYKIGIKKKLLWLSNGKFFYFKNGEFFNSKGYNIGVAT